MSVPKPQVKPAAQYSTTTGTTDGITFDGDQKALQTILSLMEPPNPNFAIVTP